VQPLDAPVRLVQILDLDDGGHGATLRDASHGEVVRGVARSLDGRRQRHPERLIISNSIIFSLSHHALVAIR
jgi:hypothetical protein